MTDTTSVLIIARPSRRRDSLAALVASIAQVGRVSQADHPHAAWAIIQHNPPTLILFDSAAADEAAWSLLSQIKLAQPHLGSIVLADNLQHQQQAQVIGVDQVLLTGTSASEFFATIEQLIVRCSPPLAPNPASAGEPGKTSPQTRQIYKKEHYDERF